MFSTVQTSHLILIPGVYLYYNIKQKINNRAKEDKKLGSVISGKQCRETRTSVSAPNTDSSPPENYSDTSEMYNDPDKINSDPI